MHTTRFIRAVSALALLLGATACDDLAEFRTGDGEVFSGQIVGSDSDDGADSFWIEGGKVVAQTIHYTVKTNDDAS